MSFNPRSKLVAAVLENKDEEYGLPFLHPVAPTTSMMSDPAKAERSFDEARRRTLRALNAIKTVSPVLAAVAERHGAGGAEEEAIATFKQLISQSSEMSELVIRELGEDPSKPENYWLRNMLERSFCEMLKDQIQRGKPGSLRSLEPLLRQVATLEWRDGDKESFSTWGADTVIRAALVRACAPIMAKVAGFDFFRLDLGQDMEDIMRLLMAAASRATLAMADPYAGERERASLFSVLIGEAGQLYASAWHSCGKQMVQSLSSLNDKELKALLAQSPQGLSLEKVTETFERNFMRLVNLSGKLVPQKSGKLEARMKSGDKVGEPS